MATGTGGGIHAMTLGQSAESGHASTTAPKDDFSAVILSQMAVNLLPIDWALKTATFADVC